MITEEQKRIALERFRVGIFDMALGDIYRAANGGAKMGAFVLCSCFIDYLAGFRYGKPATRKEYKNFVSEYLAVYDPETIYTDMRCGIVHNYTEGGSYNFLHSLPQLHFYRPGGIGKVCINLENFIADLENAANVYYSQLQHSDELIALAWQRLQERGILSVSNEIM